MRIALLALLLSGCATIPQTTRYGWSPCGVRLAGSDDLEGYAKAEAAVVKSPYQCLELVGWVVRVQPTLSGSWVTARGDVVRGETSCETLTMVVGDDDWRHNSVRHELLHALDCPMKDVAHERHDYKNEM